MVYSETTVNAQRFLASAFDTVEDLLSALDVVRTYSGAGLDSSLKQLLRDALPRLLREPDSQASKELLAYSTRRIAATQSVDPEATAALLLAANPRDVLLTGFVEEMTGASIQSVAAVHRLASVLGMPQRHDVRAAINALRPSFEARNQVAHELDLQVPLGQGDRQKRTRTMNQTVPLIHSMLDVPQRLINNVASVLA